jgi:hypothetical protein
MCVCALMCVSGAKRSVIMRVCACVQLLKHAAYCGAHACVRQMQVCVNVCVRLRVFQELSVCVINRVCACVQLLRHAACCVARTCVR